MKVKLIFIILTITLLGTLANGCDKGTDSVGFEYYLDANNRRVVHFTATGESDYGVFAYKWSFGDGFSGTGQEITHAFSDFGKYTVTLTAEIKESKIKKIVSKEIEVVIPKITNLDFEVVPDKRDPRLYNFKAVSNVDYGNVEYEWNFGNGMTTNGEIVQYAFDYFGDYEVILKASLEEYDKVLSINKKYVKVAAPSITKLDIYAFQDNDNPFLYHFKPIAETNWGTLEYEWSFGDGKIAFDQEVQNLYSRYGSYLVKVKGTIKETGTSKELTKTIEVEPPVFKNYDIIYSIDPTDPLKVNFTIENKDGQSNEIGQQDFFMWEFGNGDTATGLRTNYRFDSYGEKTVYVTLKTVHQTQKTLTKTFTLETPAIKNIKPSGKPSIKAGNIVQYNVTANSKYADEIEYTWEFSDGTIKKGKIVETDMSYWPNTEPGTPGQIKEEVYITASIPRLNIKVRDLYTIYVTKPSIKNIGINCTYSKYNTKELICNPFEDDKTPAITGGGGGDIEYEWVFNGQTYSGINQKFILETEDEYKIYLTAKIANTNIIIKPSVYPAKWQDDKSTSFYCDTRINDTEDSEDALKIKCHAIYDENRYSNVKIDWNFGDNINSNLINQNASQKVEYKYNKAGVYKVRMIFKPSNGEQKVIEKEQLVLIKPTAYTTIWKSKYQVGGANKCGNIYYYFYRSYFHNNFEKYNQNDFEITNTFSGSGSCECGGINKTDNTWYSNGFEIKGGCWGNYDDQTVKTTICKKGTLDKKHECVSN